MSRTRRGPVLPDPVRGWFLAPLERFLKIESASGIVLLACAALAFAWANSPAQAHYEALWNARFRQPYLVLSVPDAALTCTYDILAGTAAVSRS